MVDPIHTSIRLLRKVIIKEIIKSRGGGGGVMLGIC